MVATGMAIILGVAFLIAFGAIAIGFVIGLISIIVAPPERDDESTETESASSAKNVTDS